MPQTVEELHKSVEYWRDRAFKAERELRLYKEIRRAPVLKPIDKDIIEEFRHIETYGTVKDSADHTRANFTTIAARLHTSADTVSRSAARMEKLGLVSIREHLGPQDQHERKYIQIDPAKLEQISQLQDVDGVVPKQGGDRYSCQKCDSANVVIKRRLHCNDCGHETELDPVYPNGKKCTTGITRKSNLLLDDTAIADDTENGHNMQKTQKQVAFGADDDELLMMPEPTEVESDDSQKQNAEQCVYTPSSPQIAFESPEPVYSVIIETEDVEPPTFLRDKKIWAVHRDKVPYIAEMSRAEVGAKSSDPATWRTYEEAKGIYERSIREGWKKPYSGIGLMNDGTFTVLDYDHCIVDGAINEQVLYRAQDIDSYAEVSPSSTGVHQIVIGTIPHAVKKSDIEMYCAYKLDTGKMEKGRFLTWTGKHIIGLRATIQEGQEQLTQLHTMIAEPVHLREKREQQATPACVFTGNDEELLAKIQSRNAKFTKLWNGDASDYLKKNGEPDYSSADMALCAILAYWTKYDEIAIDRLFRQSKLFRTKWDERRGSTTYGERTIARACGERLSA